VNAKADRAEAEAEATRASVASAGSVERISATAL
jgi:hypothetical protein